MVKFILWARSAGVENYNEIWCDFVCSASASRAFKFPSAYTITSVRCECTFVASQLLFFFGQSTITKNKLHFEKTYYINYQAIKIYTNRMAATFVPGNLWLHGTALSDAYSCGRVHYIRHCLHVPVQAGVRIYCVLSLSALRSHFVVNAFIHHFRSILFNRLCAPSFCHNNE